VGWAGLSPGAEMEWPGTLAELGISALPWAGMAYTLSGTGLVWPLVVLPMGRAVHGLG
jgi:hypothetical protein